MPKPKPLDTAAIERATPFDALIFLGRGKCRIETFATSGRPAQQRSEWKPKSATVVPP